MFLTLGPLALVLAIALGIGVSALAVALARRERLASALCLACSIGILHLLISSLTAGPQPGGVYARDDGGIIWREVGR